MNRKMKLEMLLELRRFVAGITYQDGSQVTTTIQGRNPDSAEKEYLAQFPEVKRCIVYSELR